MFINIASYAGAFFCFIGFLLFFIMYNNVYFIMDSNNLIVIKKALCRKKTHIYYPGELIRIDFSHKYSHRENETAFNYSLVIVLASGKNNTIFKFGCIKPIFTNEEIDYFLYYINTYIQKKMKA